MHIVDTVAIVAVDVVVVVTDSKVRTSTKQHTTYTNKKTFSNILNASHTLNDVSECERYLFTFDSFEARPKQKKKYA